MTGSELAHTDRSPIVVLEGVSKQYRQGHTRIDALVDVGLQVEPGEVVAVHGRSGSGKTTLLNIVGGLEDADRGRVEVCGTELGDLSERGRAALRREQVSFVFQAFGLLPVLSAAENVEVPLRLLGAVGLAGRARHRPTELSGGEQQRVAIARALATGPRLVVADEPTGQLDHATGQSVMALLRELVRDRSLSLLVATHDQSIIDGADRAVGLHDGRIVGAAPR
jgi:putative ABC transport system ATP-binding protein